MLSLKVSNTLMVVALTLLGGCRWTSNGQAPEAKSSIRFHLVDAFGRAVPFRVDQFTQVGPSIGANLASSFRNDSADNLPTGYYKFTLAPVDRVHYSEVTGTVTLLGAMARWFTVITEEKGPELDSHMPRGHNQGIVSGFGCEITSCWVRLIRAFDGSTVEEVPVGRNGAFHFDGFHTGTYIVAVYQGEEVIHLRTIKMRYTFSSPMVVRATADSKR